jgi:hypothetical protein
MGGRLYSGQFSSFGRQHCDHGVIIATLVVVIAIAGLIQYLAMPETTDASELQSSGEI